MVQRRTRASREEVETSVVADSSKSLSEVYETNNESPPRAAREEVETSVVANSSKSLSKVYETNNESPPSPRKFKCKTCNREFLKFQALGGHRASHKKPVKLTSNGQECDLSEAKMHECSICGARFGIGQALGGHMRKHQELLKEAKANLTRTKHRVVREVLVGDKAKSVFKKIQNEKAKRSRRKKVNLDLDLNLTPPQNNLEQNRKNTLSMNEMRHDHSESRLYSFI